ncbi:DUF2079 domain-containing protein [Lentisphaerota bacterium WC36G]|nr:DUF2079 domain-containing protein [Lentisphaerae bacterium WC36]
MMFFINFCFLSNLINVTHFAEFESSLNYNLLGLCGLIAVLGQFFLGRVCGGENSLKAFYNDFEIGTQVCLPSLLYLPSLGIFFSFYTPESFNNMWLGVFVNRLYLSFFSPALLVIVMSFIGVRFAAVFSESNQNEFLFKKLNNKKISGLYVFFLSLLIICGVCYGVYLQKEFLNKLILSYYDWALFLNVTDNTLDGKWFYSNEMNHNFMGRHFMPLSILLLTPFVWLARHINTIFVINSITLFGSALVLFQLAKTYKLRTFSAFLISCAYIFYPSITNLNSCYYLGFHCVYFIIPIIWLFFILLEKKKYYWALTLFFLSMLIKESVPILWLGTGIYMLCRKQYKWALLMIIFSPIYFLVISMIVAPYFAAGFEGSDNYYFFSYYKTLAPNQSYSEIIFAPFTKPKLFFGLLFRISSISFIVVLTCSLLPIIIRYPLPIVSGLILYTLFFIQDDAFRQNINMQYQTEIIPFIFLSVVLGTRYFFNGKWGQKWSSFVFKGLKVQKNASKRFSLVLGVVPAVMLSLYFYGDLPYTKNQTTGFTNEADHSILVNEIKKYLPKNVKATLSPQLASHFVLRNDCYIDIMTPEDYVIIYLNKDFPVSVQQKYDTLREAIHQSKMYELACKPLWDGTATVLIYKKKNTTQPNQNIKFFNYFQNIKYSRFKKFGAIYPVKGCPEIEIRVQQKQTKNGIKLFFAVFSKEKLKNDYYFNVQILERDNKKLITENVIYYGDGHNVPWRNPKNSLFCFEVSAQLDSNLKIAVAPRVIKQIGPSYQKAAEIVEYIRTKK